MLQASHSPLQPSSHLAVDPVTDFWSKLADATHTPGTNEEACGQVKLAAHTYWLGLIENGQTLLERRCYRSLWAEVQVGWNETPRKSTLIIGTPGIGQ